MADQNDNQQDSRQDAESELFNLYRFSTTCLALGIPKPKAAGDFRFVLENLRQRGVLSLEDLTRVRARTAGEDPETPTQWAAGFTEGYLAAWAAAVLRVLDTRGVEFSKHLHRALNLCLDADALTRFLDRAVTVTDEADLVAAELNLRSPDGSWSARVRSPGAGVTAGPGAGAAEWRAQSHRVPRGALRGEGGSAKALGASGGLCLGARPA